MSSDRGWFRKKTSKGVSISHEKVVWHPLREMARTIFVGFFDLALYIDGPNFLRYAGSGIKRPDGETDENQNRNGG